MKTTLLIAASALTLAGCQGASYATAKLDCPATEGDLTRVSVSGDGKACAYRSSDGAEVDLKLVPITGDAQATLAAIEAALRSTPGPPPPAADAGESPLDATPADAPAQDLAAEVARVQAQAAADASAEPQLAEEDGRQARGEVTRIDLPGVKITADDQDAQIRIGPLKVDSKGDDTTINLYRNVRMRGEALSREKRGLRATFIYTGKDLPAGYRYIGYEAGGPKAGPLTVARVRSRIDTESGDNINHDVRELVRRNGGV